VAKKRKEKTPALPIDPDGLLENQCKDFYVNGKHIVARKHNGVVTYYELTPLRYV